LASPLAGQDHAVCVFATGGVNDLANLNDAGTLDLNTTGWNLGAGVGVQVQKYITLRADFTAAQSALYRNGADIGQDVDRFFYDAAVQFQYLFPGGAEPYVFAGGGGVTIHQAGTSGEDATKGTFTYGVGLNYGVPYTGLQFFLQAQNWVYDPTDMTGAMSGLDKWQNDLAWSAGVGYRFGF